MPEEYAAQLALGAPSQSFQIDPVHLGLRVAFWISSPRNMYDEGLADAAAAPPFVYLFTDHGRLGHTQSSLVQIPTPRRLDFEPECAQALGTRCARRPAPRTREPAVAYAWEKPAAVAMYGAVTPNPHY